MRERVTAHHIANEIRMKRSQHNGAFLIVEGGEDKRLFRRFVQGGRCEVVVAHNKDNVEGAVSILDDESFTGVLGVVDSDFDVLEGRSVPSENVVRIDCHDLDVMLVRSSALEAVLGELGSEEKLRRFEESYGGLRERLVAAACGVGYLRWYSRRQGLGLRFEGLRFSRFVDRETLVLNRGTLVEEVRNRSQNWALREEELIEGMRSLEDASHDPWHVCCGHDLIEVLGVGLRHALGSQTGEGRRLEQISRGLRLAYDSKEFHRSHVRNAIREWEGRNAGFTVLKGME